MFSRVIQQYTGMVPGLRSFQSLSSMPRLSNPSLVQRYFFASMRKARGQRRVKPTLMGESFLIINLGQAAPIRFFFSERVHLTWGGRTYAWRPKVISPF